MKKRLFLFMASAALFCGNVAASEDTLVIDSRDYLTTEQLTPTYLDYIRTDYWGSNWFLNVQGGISAFCGHPVGCGDMTDRIMPNLNISFGKFITPQVALRLYYQGMKFKNTVKETHNYFTLRADFMFNIATFFRSKSTANPKWDLLPYVGIGVSRGAVLHHTNCPCHACNGSNYPFTIGYGVQARYRIGEYLHLTGEIGNFTTMSDFDNLGNRRSMRDNMPSVSVGLAVTLGKSGWDRAIDAKPYIAQNDYLISEYKRLKDIADNCEEKDKNNSTYSGLEALKARLMERHKMELDRLKAEQQRYNDSLRAARAYNFPIYFFFKKGTVILTDRSQLLNLEELARVAKEHGLTLRVEGAADAATGTPKINRKLSINRCRFLVNELKKRGVEVKNIKGVSRGGVRDHKRIQEDRHAKVAIYVDLSEDSED